MRLTPATRNGSCNMDADLLVDADLITATGTLSF
jgi:hypothetical protein